MKRSSVIVFVIAFLLFVPATLAKQGSTGADRLNEKESSGPVEIVPGLELTTFRFVDTGVYRHEGGDRTTAVLGEMKNLTDQTLDAPGFKFILYDEDGNIVGDIIATPLFLTIGPGETMPFDNGIFGDEPFVGTWATEEVLLCNPWPATYWASQIPDLTGVEIRDVVESGPLDDGFPVSGKVYNGTDLPLDGIWVKAAIYDKDGRFSGDHWTSVDYVIPPGKTAPFDLASLSPVDAVGIAGPGATYKIMAGYSSSFSSCQA